MREYVVGSSLLLALLGATSIALPAAAAAEESDKEFVVYFGLDLAVDERGTECPIVSGNDMDVAILRDGKRVRVPVKEAKLKTTMEPKLGRGQLTIEDVDEERVYSPRSDPTRDALAQQMIMATAQSQAQEANEYQANRAAANAESIQQAAAAPYSQVTQDQVLEAQNQSNLAAARLESSYAVPMFNTALPGNFKEGGGDFDAFEVSFRISAPEATKNAFGVLRLLVRDPAGTRAPLQVVKFFTLRDLEPRARKVTVLQTSLPRGFSVDSYFLHFYADGRELPTNLSKNRVELSQDEAHQFLILQYLQRNRNASVPPELIPEILPLELTSLIRADQRGISVDVVVSREGRVTSVTPSQGSAIRLSPELEAALRRACFLPALLNGTPVEGLGTFALSEFAP